jgi:hypothetical protein
MYHYLLFGFKILNAIFNFMKSFLISRDFKILIIVFILTRLILLIAGINVRNTAKVVRQYDLHNEMEFYGKVGTIAHGWDSHWYLEIAGSGYQKTDASGESESHLVFFPLYPYLVRFFSYIAGNVVVSAAILSNVFYFLAGVFLYKLISIKYKSLALMSAVVLFTFPTGFIFSAIQSESLFLLLILMSFYFLETKRFLLAAVFGFFLSLTKHVGFLIFVPVLFYCFKNLKFLQPLGKLKALAYGFVPIFGFIIFNYYLFLLTGDILAILNLEKGWSKGIDFNLLKPLMLINSPVNPFLVQVNYFIGLFIVFLALAGSRLLGISYLYIVVSFLLVYLSTTSLFWHTFSLGRYFSVLFPAYFYLASISAELKWTKYAVPVVLMFFQVLLFHFWTRGWPIPM